MFMVHVVLRVLCAGQKSSGGEGQDGGAMLLPFDEYVLGVLIIGWQGHCLGDP